MSNTPSLLPCPFCGKTHSLIVGAASEAWDVDEHGPYPHTESYAVFCDASTDGRRGGCGGAGGYRLTKDEAIEVWNRRTPQPVVREPLTCEWTHNEDDGFWDTGCGQSWRFDDGGPKENHMNFCHSCGKPLSIKGDQHGTDN